MWLLNLQSRIEGSLTGEPDPLVRRNMYIELLGSAALGIFFGAPLQFIPSSCANWARRRICWRFYVTQNYDRCWWPSA
ncbi:MAG: hypothetical protein R2873_15860 [Caldilineaceae bacterium]